MTILNPFFGKFGGMYVPEVLIPALDELEATFVEAQHSKEFKSELNDLLNNYAGRPTCLTRCRNLTQGTKTTIFLKREDLLHGGAHKTNQVIGQALLARRMGKTRIIAETGAGQHGVATALICALMGFECRVYMGAKDVARQKPNVLRMELMGAEVCPVTEGSATLKEACNAALRDDFRPDMEEYLYDLRADPAETRNLIHSKEHREVKARLRKMLIDLARRAGEPPFVVRGRLIAPKR